jgi:hypothetical protein
VAGGRLLGCGCSKEGEVEGTEGQEGGRGNLAPAVDMSAVSNIT